MLIEAGLNPSLLFMATLFLFTLFVAPLYLVLGGHRTQVKPLVVVVVVMIDRGPSLLCPHSPKANRGNQEVN